MAFQHRYVVYSLEHGKTPESMLAADRQQWPGACMCGFMLWISERWGEFSKSFGRDRHVHSPDDHIDFDAWLASRVEWPSQRELF